MSIYLQTVSEISKQSKYLTWYSNIILRARSRALMKKDANNILGYSELHHILPKCLCEHKQQKNDKENKVYLSGQEHFICHWLLTKMINHHGLNFGLFMLSKRCNNGKHYELMRRTFSKKSSIKKLSYSHEKKQQIINKAKQTNVSRYGPNYATIMNPMLNRYHSDKTKDRISNISKKLKHSTTTKDHLSMIRSNKNGNASTFRVTLPSGEEFITDKLLQFCKEHSISYSLLNKNKDGYKLTNLTPPKWKITYEGQVLFEHSLKQFCVKNNLNYSTAYTHVKNKTKYKNYFIETI